MFKLSLLLVLNIVYINAQDYCAPFQFNQGPDGFPTIPQQFTTNVVVNLIEEKRTRELRLGYSYNERKAFIDTLENNQFRKQIFNYETDEIYTLTATPNVSSTSHQYPFDYQPLYPTICSTSKLTGNVDLTFGSDVVNSMLMPGAAGKILKFDKPQAYDGVKQARGIQCDTYKSCLYDEERRVYYTVTHYFTPKSFIFPGTTDTNGRLLLRAVFNSSDKSSVHDYYNFRQQAYSSEFLTPGAVYCTNRKETNITTPPIPSSFKYSEEVIEKGYLSYITNLNFNEYFQLTRYQSRKRSNDTDFSFSNDGHTYIHDYNVGIAYITNIETGKCYIRSISPFSYDSDQQYTQQQIDAGNGYMIRLKSPQSLLHLDSKFVFTGKRNINEIPSNVFVSSTTNAKIDITNEYAFSVDEFNVGNIEEKENNVPIRLFTQAEKAGLKTYSSFFNFDRAPLDIDIFELSHCFNESELIRFNLRFKPGPNTNTSELRFINVNKVFATPVLRSLGRVVDEKALRFSIPKLSLSFDGNLFARSIILPAIQPLAFFSLVGNNLLIGTSFVYLSNVPTLERCAFECYKMMNNCMSFDYSPDYKGCYLNQKHYLNGTLSQLYYYVHYSRNTLYAVKFDENYVLWEKLRELIRNQTYEIELQTLNSRNQTIDLHMIADVIEKAEVDRNRFGLTSALNRYNLKYQNTKLKNPNGRVRNDSTIDDCATACTDEIGAIKCNSFQYNFFIGECILFTDYTPQDQSNYLPDDHTDVYEKDGLAHYNKLSTAALISNKDILFTNINEAVDCAKKCDEELKIHCRSFNFCENEKKCYLSERHLVDSNGDTSSSNFACTHYSRKYIEDFTFISTGNIKLEGEIIIRDTTLDLCSLACVDADGFLCKSFNFCPITKTCILNSDTKPSPITDNTNRTDTCSLYKREYFTDTSTLRNLPKSKDHSEATLTALSIVFVALSIVAGIAGTIFLLKKKGKI